MTCSSRRCRHEFCWVCTRPWDMHGTSTGGYFSCNIYREEDEGKTGATDEDKGKDSAFGTAKEQTRRLQQSSATMSSTLRQSSNLSRRRRQS